MLVHRGERLKVEPLGDLLEAGSVAAMLDVLGEIVEDLALTAGERHDMSPED